MLASSLSAASRDYRRPGTSRPHDLAGVADEYLRETEVLELVVDEPAFNGPSPSNIANGRKLPGS